jgi:hypothetical protein
MVVFRAVMTRTRRRVDIERDAVVGVALLDPDL